MTEISKSTEGPLNDLYLAINCYVSTGDNVGEGAAIPVGSKLQIYVAYDPANPADVADFDKFDSRVREIMQAGQMRIEWDKAGQDAKFKYWVLIVKPDQLRPLAAELTRSGGKAGYGSTYNAILDTFGSAIDRIKSGEGA